jgi:hypothetical protein
MSIELDMLLSEDVASARQRAKNAFRDLAGDRDIVLVGANGLAERVGAEMRKAGRTVLATVSRRDLTASVTRHPDAVFVVCDGVDTLINDANTLINDASHSTLTTLIHESTMVGLSACFAAGAARVTSFALFAWSHPEGLLPFGPIDLPEHVLEEKEDVRRAYDVLADDRSRQRYVGEVRFRLHLDFAGASGLEVGSLPTGAEGVPIREQRDLWRVPLSLGAPVVFCAREGALVATRAPGG